MSHLSVIASPMYLHVEDLYEYERKVESEIKRYEKLQKDPPPSFIVGTIGEINRRISNLDEQLPKYDSKLAIDCRTPEPEKRPDSYAESYTPSITLRKLAASEKKQELSKLPGKQSGTSLKSADTPRLVELQQYPGWNAKRHNPLPHSLQTCKVLDHVVAAQENLQHKSAYKRDFCRLLYSDLQECILQDTFWWFFLKKFHPDPITQSRLFRRIATNFVSFLLSAEVSRYKNVFFMAYGSVLAQSTYSGFCLAFPQSWRQFDDFAFKGSVSKICGEWVSGIPPPPQACDKWNFSALEPKGMRKEASIKMKKKPEHTAKVIRQTSVLNSAAPAKIWASSSATGRQKHRIKMPISSNHAMKPNSQVGEIASQHTALPSIAENRLSPIKENTAIEKRINTSTKPKTSCVAGRSMEFSRNVFNVFGCSPLLTQFFRQYGFERTAYYDVLVNLTLIDSVAPKGSQTYEDVIEESCQNTALTAENFTNSYQQDIMAHKAFCSKQREDRRAFWDKTNELLAKPKQVRVLCNRLLVELNNNEEDVNSVNIAMT